MGAQAKLFHANNYPLGDQVDMIEKMLVHKHSSFHCSLGVFKTNPKGLISHNALLVLTDNSGRPATLALEAETLPELIGKIFEALQNP